MTASGCATPDLLTQEPVLPQARATQNALFELPPPAQKLSVAVYKFEDETGQFKPAEGYQNLSRAVSQGGASLLVKALQDAGDGQWFTVIERSSLTSLLQERKIITEMRQRYLGETKPDFDFLPPMRFAGILMEGGIVGYDSNTLTGGAGARLLGIGAQAEYRQDTISVNLRAVSVRTGEVMASTIVHKTLISAGLTGGSFSFIDVDKLLELEAGVSTNEPGLIALSKAIEKAVHTLIIEGADRKLWAFKDPEIARPLISEYRVANGRPPLVAPSPRQVAQKVTGNRPINDAVATSSAAPKPKAAGVSSQPVAVKPAPARPTGKSQEPVSMATIGQQTENLISPYSRQTPPRLAKLQHEADHEPTRVASPETTRTAQTTPAPVSQPEQRAAATDRPPVDLFTEVIVNGRTVEHSTTYKGSLVKGVSP